jgi:predicted RNase H-like nuclease
MEFRARVVTLRELLSLSEDPKIVALDLPIGLPDITLPGGRSCERLARSLLGWRRARSVFSAVGRRALQADTRAEADEINRKGGGVGIGAQAWGLSKKLREVDALITPDRQQLIREIHPEVSFAEMSGLAREHGKKSRAGKQERIAALVDQGFPVSFVQTVPAGVRAAQDDFLDACAAVWTAERIYRGVAKRIPEIPEHDERGLDMAIWF